MISFKVLAVFTGLTICSFCYSQEIHFTIKGRLSNKTSSQSVFLQGDIHEKVPVEANGGFSYSGLLPEPGILLIKTENSFAWGIWVTEGDIVITLEEYNGKEIDPSGKQLLRVTSLSGPPETEKQQWFLDTINALSRKFATVPAEQKKDSITKYYYPAVEDYIHDHPGSRFSTRLINLFTPDEVERDKLVSLNSGMNSEEAKKIEKLKTRERLLTPGNPISILEQYNTKGKLFSLEKLSSQYILIEIWASDCPPCRVSNPGLVATYKSFRKLGFGIVGISLDRSEKEWRKAIKKDKLSWIQVSDLKGWDNDFAVKYMVDYIPFNILIDKNRTVVATNLDNVTLENKLKELLVK